ncbi:MFS transporter [Chloroflexota bacterium]
MKVHERFPLWVILTAAPLTVVAGSVIAPILNLVREELGIDPAAAGLIVTGHQLFIAIFSPLVGILVDKVGARRPFVFGLIIYGLSGGSGLFINSYWILIISRALLGITAAVILVSTVVFILNLYEGKERNKIMGWRSSGNSLSSVIWPLIGGFLGGFSWHLPFAVYLVGIPLGFIALNTIPEIRKEEHKDVNDVPNENNTLNIFRNNPILFVIYGVLFVANFLLATFTVFLPQLLGEIGISNPFHISLFIMVGGLSIGLTSLLHGRIKSRLSYKMIVYVALALWAIGFITISLVFSGLVIASSVVVLGIGLGMVLPAALVWLSEVVPISFHGRFISYVGTFGFIGGFFPPIIFRPVVLLLNLNSVFMIAGGACAILFLLFLAIFRK